MNIRKAIAAALKPELPKTWQVIPYAAVPANPRHPVIIMRTQAIAKTPEAPRLFRNHTYLLGLVVAELDPAKVEDALDVAIEALLDALEALDFPGLLWGEATRATFDDKFHGYDVAVTITTEKE